VTAAHNVCVATMRSISWVLLCCMLHHKHCSRWHIRILQSGIYTDRPPRTPISTPSRPNTTPTSSIPRLTSTQVKAMCKTIYWKSASCGHTWYLLLLPPNRHTKLILPRLELSKPCANGRNLMNCPDFSGSQPYGPADMPSRRARHAPPEECPTCDYECHDMRRRRMCEFRRTGVRLAFYPAPNRRTPGVDVVCCAVM
jgi:hypothetical protein